MELREELEDELFNLGGVESEIISYDICNPWKVIVHVDEMPTAEWIKSMTDRINTVLRNGESAAPTIYQKAADYIESTPTIPAWMRGVKAYALELLE